MAPALLLNHKLEILRSLCREAAKSGDDLIVEVFLRLWHLQSKRLIELKEFAKLQLCVQLWKPRDVDAKTLDSIATPHLFILLSNLKHEPAVKLAAKYLSDIFFSDESLVVLKGDNILDIVDLCVSYYHTYQEYGVHLNESLDHVPDEIISAHDEALLFATACLAWSHPEPLRDGPQSAVKVFSERNRTALSQHCQDFVKAILNNRQSAKMVDSYWNQMPIDAEYCDSFWEKKKILLDAGKKHTIEQMENATEDMEKWRTPGRSLREGAVRFWDQAILDYFADEMERLLALSNAEADHVSMAARDEAQAMCARLLEVARRSTDSQVLELKAQLEGQLSKISTANNWESLKAAVEGYDGADSNRRLLKLLRANKRQACPEEDRKIFVTFQQEMYTVMARAVVRGMSDKPDQVDDLKKGTDILEFVHELVASSKDDEKAGHQYFMLCAKFCEHVGKLAAWKEHTQDQTWLESQFTDYHKMCADMEGLLPKMTLESKITYETQKMQTIQVAMATNAGKHIHEIASRITSMLLQALLYFTSYYMMSE